MVDKLKEKDLELLDRFHKEADEEVIEHNKKLIERYPFLAPRNVWTGLMVSDYDFSFTELDCMPSGWRKKFGIELCEELRNELIKHDFLDSYQITQIKEKYGTLRWYDAGNTEEGHKIIRKYEDLSWDICIDCGEPATKETIGWIMPVCDKCAHERFNDEVIDK